MTCCLMATAITWTNIDLSFMSSSIHLRPISQEIPQPSVIEISFKIPFKLVGANELNLMWEALTPIMTASGTFDRLLWLLSINSISSFSLIDKGNSSWFINILWDKNITVNSDIKLEHFCMQFFETAFASQLEYEKNGVLYSQELFGNTPVIQDGDLAAICKIGLIVAGSLWGLAECYDSAVNHSMVPRLPTSFEHVKTSTVRSQWNQDAVASLLEWKHFPR